MARGERGSGPERGHPELLDGAALLLPDDGERGGQHRGQHEQDAAEKKHEADRHGQAALHQVAALDVEPEACLGQHHGGALVVGGPGGEPNSSTAALVASGLMQTLCSNGTWELSWIDTM